MRSDIIFGREELLFIISDLSSSIGVLNGISDILKVLTLEDIEPQSLKALLEDQENRLEKVRLQLNQKYFPRGKDDDNTG